MLMVIELERSCLRPGAHRGYHAVLGWRVYNALALGFNRIHRLLQQSGVSFDDLWPHLRWTAWLSLHVKEMLKHTPHLRLPCNAFK